MLVIFVSIKMVVFLLFSISRRDYDSLFFSNLCVCIEILPFPSSLTIDAIKTIHFFLHTKNIEGKKGRYWGKKRKIKIKHGIDLCRNIFWMTVKIKFECNIITHVQRIWFPWIKKKNTKQNSTQSFSVCRVDSWFLCKYLWKKIKIIDKWQISCNCFETIEPVAKYYVNIKWHTHNILIA